MNAGTVTYTDHSTGEPVSERDAATIGRARQDLMNGRYFALHAASDRSSYGYRPPTNHRAWAHCIETLGKMAGQSPQLAQIAQAIVGNVPLYQTNHEASAKVYEAAARALAQGYDDVIGRSGPEAGRYSDHQHEFGIAVRVHLAYWLAEATSQLQSSLPGVGWCVSAIARAENVHVVPHFLPSLAAGEGWK